MAVTIPKNLWAVFRGLPGEPHTLRSVSLTAEEAARSCDREAYKTRDLEDYEGVSYYIKKYKLEENENT